MEVTGGGDEPYAGQGEWERRGQTDAAELGGGGGRRRKGVGVTGAREALPKGRRPRRVPVRLTAKGGQGQRRSAGPARRPRPPHCGGRSRSEAQCRPRLTAGGGQGQRRSAGPVHRPRPPRCGGRSRSGAQGRLHYQAQCRLHQQGARAGGKVRRSGGCKVRRCAARNVRRCSRPGE